MNSWIILEKENIVDNELMRNLPLNERNGQRPLTDVKLDTELVYINKERQQREITYVLDEVSKEDYLKEGKFNGTNVKLTRIFRVLEAIQRHTYLEPLIFGLPGRQESLMKAAVEERKVLKKKVKNIFQELLTGFTHVLQINWAKRLEMIKFPNQESSVEAIIMRFSDEDDITFQPETILKVTLKELLGKYDTIFGSQDSIVYLIIRLKLKEPVLMENNGRKKKCLTEKLFIGIRNICRMRDDSRFEAYFGNNAMSLIPADRLQSPAKRKIDLADNGWIKDENNLLYIIKKSNTFPEEEVKKFPVFHNQLKNYANKYELYYISEQVTYYQNFNVMEDHEKKKGIRYFVEKDENGEIQKVMPFWKGKCPILLMEVECYIQYIEDVLTPIISHFGIEATLLRNGDILLSEAE